MVAASSEGRDNGAAARWLLAFLSEIALGAWPVKWPRRFVLIMRIGMPGEIRSNLAVVVQVAILPGQQKVESLLPEER